MLQGAGWTVELVSSIRVVEFNAGYLNCDCVIIDYSRRDNSKKLSQGQLDEIEIIKLLGYRGMFRSSMIAINNSSNNNHNNNHNHHHHKVYWLVYLMTASH